LRADRRKVDEQRRVAVDDDVHLSRNAESRRAARAALIERRLLRRRRRDDRHRRAAAAVAVGGRRRAAGGQHAHRVVVVRDDANPHVIERRVRLDAVDERHAARRRREERFESDDLRPALGDDFERQQRVGVREREQLAVEARRALLQRGEHVRPADQYGARIHERPSICHNPRVIQPPYRDVTVGDLLTRLALALPTHDALVYETGPRYTFQTLEHEARTIARGLIAAGVAQGERVVLWATNVPEWVVLQFALAKIGAILVTANTSLRARDIDYLLRQSEAATLITIRGFRDLDYIHELERAGRPPGLKRIIYIGADTPPGLIPYAELHAIAPRVSEADLDAGSTAVAVDDVINMQYPSGTTGFPKGVMLSSRNIVNNGEALGRMLGYTPADRLCLCVPLF